MSVCRRIDSYRTAIACIGNSPTEFGKLLADETEKWGKVSKADLTALKCDFRSTCACRKSNPDILVM